MGKKSRQSPRYDKKLERLVTEEFNHAIRVARKGTNRSNAAKIYDLMGPILKRRKQAVLASMETVRERYAALYLELAVEEEWARQNCAMGHSVDGADHLYYITLAAALWMLDALKQSGKLREAFRYFTSDEMALEEIDLPEMHDPCHDESVIRGMMHLIQEQDERDNPYQRHINDMSAQRYGPASPSAATLADIDNMTNRERFHAVMAMIHPILKERAVQRFEAKLWEFVDGYFHCAARYVKEQTEQEQRMEKLSTQCKDIFGEIKEKERGLDVFAAKPKPGPFALKPSLPLPSFGTDNFFIPSVGKGLEPDRDTLDYLAKQGIACVERVEELEKMRAGLLLAAHMAPIAKPGELHDNRWTEGKPASACVWHDGRPGHAKNGLRL